MAKVLNARIVGKCPPNSVYGGRPGPFGNQFIIGPDGTRAEVIEKHRLYLESDPVLQAKIKEQRGKDWVCWCAPAPCHCDNYLKMANEEASDGN